MLKSLFGKGYYFFFRAWRRVQGLIDLRKPILGFCGKGVVIHPSAVLPNPLSIFIGDGTHIWDHSFLGTYFNGQIHVGTNSIINSYARLNAYEGNIKVGKDSTLNEFSLISCGGGGVVIGNGVRIGAHTMIVASNHATEDRETPIWRQGIISEGVIIHDGVWIGSNVVVLDGIEIGEGTIIGAGSVVTKDIPPYSVAVGVPVKVLRQR